MSDPTWQQDLDNPEVVARIKAPWQVEVERLRGALVKLRTGIIEHATDTVWCGPGETAVDFITNALGEMHQPTIDALAARLDADGAAVVAEAEAHALSEGE